MLAIYYLKILSFKELSYVTPLSIFCTVQTHHTSLNSQTYYAMLIQAIIRHSKHDGKEEEHKRMIAELEEKERKEMEELR